MSSVNVPAIATACFCAALGAAGAAASPGPGPASAAPAIVAPQDRAYPGSLHVDADASDIERRIVHVTEQISGIDPGTVLLYPRWLPGNHSTTGPIERF